MTTKHLKSMFAADRRRIIIALSFLACLNLIVFSSSFAQLKGQRRVTGLQLGAAAEGSRVTVVADSPLNDYEAFRRGDRFYVKIPLADFMSALPHFRGDGFENVQVQKNGDSLIVSFKLQPGATARINQYGNRLDVVFSAPNRSPSNNVASAGSISTSTSNPGAAGSATQPWYRPDAAGPLPPGSSASGQILVDPFDRSRNNSRNSRRANASGNNNDAALAGVTPVPSPSTTVSPAPQTSYPPLITSTPASSNSTAESSRTASSTSGDRRAAILRWMSANRLATLLGALILLSLMLYLATAVRRRKKNGVQESRTNAKVQPRFSPNEELDELLSTGQSDPVSRQENGAELPTGSLPSAAATAQDSHAWVLTRPTIVSPSAAADEHSSEQEEREVFEL